MEITYQLEREDYWAFQQILSSRLPWWQRHNLPFLFPLLILFAFDHWKSPGRGGLYIGFASGAVLVAVLMRSGSRVKADFLNRMVLEPGGVGLHTFILYRRGFDVQNSLMRTSIEWSSKIQFEENKKLIVFFLTPAFGFIIPKRAFPTPEQARLFLETAQAYRQSAINGTTPILPSIPQSWPPAPSRITQGKL